jgi:hypothetical protein
MVGGVLGREPAAGIAAALAVPHGGRHHRPPHLRQRAYALARWYRERGAIVVLGGLHVLSCPEEVAPHADAIAVGDGVRSGRGSCATSSADNSCAATKPISPPLSRRPAAAPAILPRWAFLTTASLIATRGCHNRCGFCYLSTRGLSCRTRCATRAGRAEFRATDEPYAVFIDNNLGSDRAYLHALCARCGRSDTIWSAAVTIDVTDDVRWCAPWRSAGCTGVFIGFESLEDQNLADARKRRRAPPTTRAACASCTTTASR